MRWKTLLWVALVLATLGFLYVVRGVLLPFVLALVISVILDPTVRRLRRRGISRTGAVAIVFFAFFGLLTGLGLFLVPKVSDQIARFSGSLTGFVDQIEASSRRNNVYVSWNPVLRAQDLGARSQVDQVLEQFGPTLRRLGLPDTRRGIVERYVDPNREQIGEVTQNFFNGFLGIFTGLASQVLLLLLTPLLVWMMLVDLDKWKLRTASWIPPSIRSDTLDLTRQIGNVFFRYLRGISITVSLYTGLMAIVLTLLGAPYSVLLALLFGALYIVPFIGAWISSLTLVVVIGLSGQTGNWMFDLGNAWVFGLVMAVIVQGVSEFYDKLIQPRLLGESVGLNPIASMFVIMAAGSLFGIGGMILAFPVAGSVKIVLEKLLRLTNESSAATPNLPAVPLRHRSAADG